MKARLLLFLLLASGASAGGPKYGYTDPKLDDEMGNIYHDIGSVLKGDVFISSVTIATATISTGGHLQLPDGSAASPALIFTDDPDTGIYSSAANTVSISGGGTLCVNATSTGVAIKGTTTNDAATAGNVGESVSSTAGPVSAATSNQWSDITSISLTAGDWDVSFTTYNQANGATVTLINAGIGTATGNDATGLAPADTLVSGSLPTAVLDTLQALTPRRYSLAGTTTLYLKTKQTYTVATPVAYGRLSARRMR